MPGTDCFGQWPSLHDIGTMAKLLSHMGVATRFEAPYDLVKTMRASIITLGPLVAHFGRARVSLTRGWAIGERPVDQHIKGLQAMGAQVDVVGGYIEATCSRLKGAFIRTDMPTVTGTENLMTAATLADGLTTLDNAACEPEIVDLAELLISMGARIEGQGTPTILIHGVEKLYAPAAPHRVIPDRIEAGTFLCAAVACGGDLILENARSEHMQTLIGKLEAAGARIECAESRIRIQMDGRPAAVDIRTEEHPGFPTDMQAQIMAVNCIADGSFQGVETIFENRFMHVAELRRLGADICVDGRRAMVRGAESLPGAHVMATDLRASTCFVIAGLAAKGRTT